MNLEHFPPPTNDNFPETNEAELDIWLDNFRAEVEKSETHMQAQQALTSLAQKVEVYLRSPNPKRVVIHRFSSAIHECMNLIMNTADVMPFTAMDTVERVYREINDYLDTHNEKSAD